jgi:membrane protease YdiL (CAAX protease family)
VFTVAVTVIAAVVAATGAGLAAPSLLGRNLASVELVGVGVVFALVGWGLTASRRRRERKRMLGMRDSALW